MASTRLLCTKMAAGVLCAASIAITMPAAASAHSPGHFRGVITANTKAGRAYRAARLVFSLRNLRYHGGPVMHSDANYALFWEPGAPYTTSANYKSIVTGFFGNVAAASGSTTNDYGVVRQYYDGSGNAAYNASYGGSSVVTNPYPANGCHVGSGPCITDQQIQAGLSNYVTTHGLPKGMGTIYFVFFPPGVTTCFDSSGTQCSSNVYCAYHSNIGSGSTGILYANMAYGGVSGCESGEYPNGDTGADSTVNITSHENIEAITDPLGTAWYDLAGNEIGDKCAWNFGSPLGGAPGSEFNEAIASGHYWLQQEWSNASAGCVQRY